MNLRSVLVDDRGQGTAEYAIVIGVLVVSVVFTLVAISNRLTSVYGRVQNNIETSFPSS